MGHIDIRAVSKITGHENTSEPGSGLSMLDACSVCPEVGRGTADALCCAVPAALGEPVLGDMAGIKRVSPTCSCQPAHGGKHCPHQSWWISGWFAAISTVCSETSE